MECKDASNENHYASQFREHYVSDSEFGTSNEANT